MDLVKILKDSDFIEESVRIILFSIVSILLGIKDEGFGKKYQKKYILITYLVIALYVTLIGFSDMKNKINLFFLLFFINLLGGINISYESDNMMKGLGRFRLFIFKFFEWFYITKSYIFYICFFFIIIGDEIYTYLFYPFVESFNLNLSRKHVMIFNVFLFFYYHLFSNIIDIFGFIGFEDLKKIILDEIKKFNKNNELKNSILDYMGFIVYMEDKDYFERKGSLYNLKYMIKRKRKERLKNIESQTKLLIRNNKINFNKLNRGFSTIEQQVVRTQVMYRDSYSYKFRRKLFVECIYTPMFFKVFINQRKRYDFSYTIDRAKVDILKFYYNKILEYPSNEKELFEKMAMQSKNLNVNNYRYYFHNEFKCSEEYFKIRKILRRNFSD